MNKFTLSVLLLMSFLTTNLFGQNCFPTYTNQCTSGDYINNFQLNTINNLGTNCGTPGTNNYTNYTSISTSLNQGQSYTVTCAPGPTWGQYFAAFIDFNNDGDFDDSNEYFDIGYSLGGGTVSNTMTIPTGVPGGACTLRVVCSYANIQVTAGQSCGNFSFGEVEQYIVNISPPANNDLAATSIDWPSVGCGLGMESVVATVTNTGLLEVDTAYFCYNVNGGPWFCDTLENMNLAFLGTYQHTFSTPVNMSVPGSYILNFAASCENDQLILNDSITGYVAQSVPTISALPYSEDFEASNGGWVASGTNQNWEWGAPAGSFINAPTSCSPGNNIWATSLSSWYMTSMTGYLTSPCIDFSSLAADPTLSFDHIFEVESFSDNHWVEVSTDGGVSWTVLGGIGTGLNWYNQFASWDGNSGAAGEWRKAGHVLTGTAGQSDVRVRFVFASDAFGQYEGVGIDNIQIGANTPVVEVSPLNLVAPLSTCGLTSTETITASFSNIGTSPLTGFTACFSVDGGTPVCELVTATIPPGGTYTHVFAATGDFSALGPHDVEIGILAADLDACNNTQMYTVTHRPIINSFPYLEKFENGTGGWEAQNGPMGTWELATPSGTVINSAASGSNAWITNASGFYNDNDNSSVVSPCFDFTNLPNGSWVAMKVWWNAEYSWDGANLQYTLDGGLTWTNVGSFGDPYNWYTDNSINGAPGGSQEGWSGRNASGNGSGGWVIAKHPLDDMTFVGQAAVGFRVNFGTDGSVVDEGFAFDDFAIGVPPTVDLGPDYAGCADYSIDPGLSGDYQWYTQNTVTLASNLFSTNAIGVFTNPFANDTTYYGILVLTDTLGLSGSDTITLTLSPVPNNVLSDTTLCPNVPVTFTVPSNPNNTYTWNNGGSSNSSTYTYNGGGLVELIVLNTVTGCADTVSAMIYQTPAVSIDDVTVCGGTSAVLDATSVYASYNWSTSATTSAITVNTAGTYSVTVTDNIGCTTTDNAIVSFPPVPTPTITGLPDTICINYEVSANGGAGYASYDWSTGGTAQNELISGASLGNGSHVITLTVVDANGCEGTTTQTVFVDACIGLDELSLESMVVYPNPSFGLFHYTFFGDFSGTEMTLTDLAGKTIWSKQVSQATGEIDLSAYENGTYLLTVSNGTAAKVLRLVKQ